MFVRLINSAHYEIKENKGTTMPFETLFNMCGGTLGDVASKEEIECVRLFKTIDELRSCSSEEIEELDREKDVRIMPNGQILVFLKNKNNNATTATKEDKGKQQA